MSKFEDAFDLTGYGCFNYIVTLTSGLIMMYTMIESLAIGYVMAVAECDLDLTVAEKGLINSAAFIGILSTAILWGYLSDLYGRRKVMLPAILTSCAASFSSALTTNFLSMFLLRFLTGCLVSASSATVFVYLGEMHSDAQRTSAIMWASIAIAITFIQLPVLAWLILPGTWSFKFFFVDIKPWRVFMWTWGACGLSSALILLFLPESPRYLFVTKRPEKALEVLAKMYAWNKGKRKDDYPVRAIIGADLATKYGFKDALKHVVYLTIPPLRRCMIISHISMFMIFFLNSGLYTWMPDILNVLYHNFSEQISICSAMMEYYSSKDASKMHMLAESKSCDAKVVHFMVFPTSILLGVLCIIAYVAIGLIVKKFSKITFYCLMLGICSVMLAISAELDHPWIAVILFIVGLCAGTTGSLLSAITVEVFPTSVRALALCTMYMCGRLGAAVGSNLLGVAMYKHCDIILLTMTLGTAASVLLLLMWPDPKLVRAEMEEDGFVY